MIRRSILFGSACTLITVLALGVASAQPMGRYTSPTGGFSILFPAHWERRPLGDGVVALSPQEGVGDVFRENINIVVESLATTMTPQRYATLSIRAMAGALQGFQLLREGPDQLGTRIVHWAEYEHTMGQRLRVLAFFVVTGNRGTVITCTSTAPQLARWRPLFESIVRTFR